jgi:hypothetical protein
MHAGQANTYTYMHDGKQRWSSLVRDDQIKSDVVLAVRKENVHKSMPQPRAVNLTRGIGVLRVAWFWWVDFAGGEHDENTHEWCEEVKTHNTQWLLSLVHSTEAIESLREILEVESRKKFAWKRVEYEKHGWPKMIESQANFKSK